MTYDDLAMVEHVNGNFFEAEIWTKNGTNKVAAVLPNFRNPADPPKEVAERLFSIREAMADLLGVEQTLWSGCAIGDVARSVTAQGEATPAVTYKLVDALRKEIAGNGHRMTRWVTRKDKNSDDAAAKWSYRLERREITPNYFTLEGRKGEVTDFANKTSPFRVGAKALGLAEQFDKNIISNGSRWYRDESFTTVEFLQIVEHTRKHVVKLLESVNAKPTVENINRLFVLLHLKSLRVVKECLTAMPYLKTEKTIDLNLAKMAAMGLTYDKLLLLNVSEDYPDNLEDLKVLVDTPQEWLIITQF